MGKRDQRGHVIRTRASPGEQMWGKNRPSDSNGLTLDASDAECLIFQSQKELRNEESAPKDRPSPTAYAKMQRLKGYPRLLQETSNAAWIPETRLPQKDRGCSPLFTKPCDELHIELQHGVQKQGLHFPKIQENAMG